MHKLLVLSNLHITEPGETIIGLDPAERLAEVLDHALAQHGDASHMILAGDLTHHGRPAQYARLKALLAKVPMPIVPLIGNHDDRAAFRAAFPDAPQTPDGFVQGAINIGPLRVLTLDTKGVRGHAGVLCDSRLDWLRHELDRAAPHPTVVVAHHPPLRSGFDGMDAIALQDPARLLDILRDAPHVRHLVCGHIHRTMSASIGGLAVTLLKSPCHQMPMQLGRGSSALSVDGPGGYGVVLALHDAIIVHHVEPRHDAIGPASEDRHSL